MINQKQAIQQYQNIKAQETIQNASPHRLVQMLMEGAIERITIAKAHIEQKNMAEKGRLIGKAIDIINGLRGSLNFEKGGDIAVDFERLYEFLVTRLLEANRDNDSKALNEVTFILKEIKATWDGIPLEAQQQFQQS